MALSYVRAREEAGWQQADDLAKSRQAYHSKVIGWNKGGLIVPVGGVRGFVPASQFSLSRRAGLTPAGGEEQMKKMVNDDRRGVCVIEVDRERRA